MDPAATIFCGAGLLLVGSLLGIALIIWLVTQVVAALYEAFSPPKEPYTKGFALEQLSPEAQERALQSGASDVYEPEPDIGPTDVDPVWWV